MSERPICVECGSGKVISKGVSWLCKDCGRWFTKKPRGHDFRRRVEAEIYQRTRSVKEEYGSLSAFQWISTKECRDFISELERKYNLSRNSLIRLTEIALDLI